MSIKIKNNKKNTNTTTSLEGKSKVGIISELSNEYPQKNKQQIQDLSEKQNLLEIMKLSETSFIEWDNEEDEIYNNL